MNPLLKESRDCTHLLRSHLRSVIYGLSNSWRNGMLLGLLSPLYIWINEESERLSNLPKATQLKKGQSSSVPSTRGSSLKAHFLILTRVFRVTPKTNKWNKAKTSPQRNLGGPHTQKLPCLWDCVSGLWAFSSFKYNAFLFILFRPFQLQVTEIWLDPT